jgi:hypothetical protein
MDAVWYHIQTLSAQTLNVRARDKWYKLWQIKNRFEISCTYNMKNVQTKKKSSFEKVISCDNWNANQKEIITIKLDDYLNDCEMIVFIF